MPEMKNGDKAMFEVCKDPTCPAHLGGTSVDHGHLISVERADMFSGPVHIVLPAAKPDPIEARLPTLAEAPTVGWLSIPLADVMQLVADYTTWVETAETAEVCKCEWIIHPDDINKKPEEGKRRMRRGDTSLDCPAHTKEGYLLGFFEWLKKSTPEPIKPSKFEKEHSYRDCPDPWECTTHKGNVSHG